MEHVVVDGTRSTIEPMGVFGHGPFDNDDAVDWLRELAVLETVREALELDGDEDFYDIDQVCEAYAAAAVVAALAGGKRTPKLPVRVAKQFAAQPQAGRARLVTMAIAATKLATTSTKSELRQSSNRKPLAAAGAKLIATLARLEKRLAVDPARRPKNVPETARYDRDSEMWLGGPRDARDRWHGEISFWRADGSLQQRCEHSHGTPHGAFTRYHESGAVSRTGFLARNKLDGLDICYRTKGPSSDNLLEGAFDKRIARLETEYRSGVSVTQRYFDAKGNQLTYTGDPVPKRPRSVPATAVFAQDRWSAGELDRRGLPDGKWRYWDRRGAPAFEIVFVKGIEKSRRDTHTR